jgi:hypothetical protein
MGRLGSRVLMCRVRCLSPTGDWELLITNILTNKLGHMTFKYVFLISSILSNFGGNLYSQCIQRIEIESVITVQNFEIVCRGIKEHSVTPDIVIFSDSLSASPTGRSFREITIPKFDKDVLSVCILVYIENEYRGCIQFKSRNKGIHRSKSLRISWVGVGLEYALDD